MDTHEHWNSIYRVKGEQGVSWFEPVPSISLEMMEAAGLTRETCVLDVGGGESRLVDVLLGRGLDCLAVLDLSDEALHHAQERIGAKSLAVTWISADVTGPWFVKPMDIWHDRAVFHFLVAPAQRERYIAHMHQSLKPHGTAIIATFAPDGPEKCSGLPVARYSPEALAAELGGAFQLIEARRHFHVTPSHATQAFQYSRFVRLDS